MRTTLTLNDALHERVVHLAHVRNVSFKEAVAEVVRLGLEAIDKAAAKPYRFEIKPHVGGPLKPEYEHAKIQDLLDIAEGEDRRW